MLSVPFKILGSAAGSSVAVKARPRSPHSAVAGRSAAANSALITFPSSVPVAVLVPPLRPTTRTFPDWEMEIGVLNTDDKNESQYEAEAAPAPGSVFQAPSTENGAATARPIFRTPTSPSTGNATRKMYASTKLRFVCEIALSPFCSTKACQPLRQAQGRLSRVEMPVPDITPAAGRRPRSDLPEVYATGVFRSAPPSTPWPSSWSTLRELLHRTHLPAAVSARPAGSCDR